MQPKKLFFNAHHSPIGAFASFTLGSKGSQGGLGLELGKPADENVFIGISDKTGNGFSALPFFTETVDESVRYDVEGNTSPVKKKAHVSPFADADMARDFNLSTDTFSAGDLTFSIYSPVRGIPDPQTSSDEQMKHVLLPAILAELKVDNRNGTTSRKAFFGYQGKDPYFNMRHIGLTGIMDREKLIGIGQGTRTAIMTTDDNVRSANAFTIEDIVAPAFKENLSFGLGPVMALVMTVAPGVQKTFRFAICFYNDGIVTTGITTRYFYTRYFDCIEDVGAYALDHFDMYKKWAAEADATVGKSALSPDQQFQVCHATRSYFGSSEFLVNGKEPLWIVNEGEYRMINTFDLTVDQLFFEMQMNPWTVRNVLDLFVSRYSYYDKIRFPGSDKEYEGGLSFTHDMGVGNIFSRPHFSSYEQFGISFGFPHMTHEELVNWVCCALVYVKGTGDTAWFKQNEKVFVDCFNSMLNRDHPEEAKRSGIMKLDSNRIKGAAEITTYDSLDVSLGQARNNIYLAVKCWAVYVALTKLFESHGKKDLAALAHTQAKRVANTLVSHVSPGHYIPAVLDENNDSRIIPAIEGLVFPLYTGCPEALDEKGEFGALVSALKAHLKTVLVPGGCLFADGGWKISSTSNNSWLSKIYLCQFVARKILGLSKDKQGALADAAHVDWLLHPENVYWSWSDQMVSGIAKGSKYYPRGVTSWLWLSE